VPETFLFMGRHVILTCLWTLTLFTHDTTFKHHDPCLAAERLQ
jgi:hypothetical protein